MGEFLSFGRLLACIGQFFILKKRLKILGYCCYRKRLGQKFFCHHAQQPSIKKNCGQRPLFLLSTDKQCILSHFIGTQQNCYVSRKTLNPGGIRTRVFSFLRRMQCPLRHAARAPSKIFIVNFGSK
jgi:hypothetical protein